MSDYPEKPHRRIRKIGSFPVLLIMSFLLSAGAVVGNATPDIRQTEKTQPPPLDNDTKAAIIDWICLKMDEIYVFPDVAEKMGAFLKGNLQRGEYLKITNPRAFTGRLRRDLVKISNDRHFNVSYAPEPTIRTQRPDPEEDKEREESRIRQWKYDNFYFKKVERLEGNVGYLRFDGFAGVQHGGDTAVAALQFLKHCDAVIIDLRYNGGGGADMIQLILSYFFKERTHINSWYKRKEDRTDQSWTAAYVPGQKLLDTGLYLLTSSRTFSAAEEFTYDLKNQKRATLVGETTGGGGHTVTYVRNDELKIEFKVPNSRAINPVSGDNWEAKGIEPDVKCPASEAFDRAYFLALKKLHEEAGPKGDVKQWLGWLVENKERLLQNVSVPNDILESYAGTYGPVKVLFEQSALWIIEPRATDKKPLLPLDEKTFMIEGNQDIRVIFESDEGGAITGIKVLFWNGSTNRYRRKK